MISLTRNESQHANNFPPHRRRRWHRVEPSVYVFIASSVEHDTAYFAAVLYQGRERGGTLDGWLDNTSQERAWLHALNLCYEWRDANASRSRLVILDSDRRVERQKRRAA